MTLMLCWLMYSDRLSAVSGECCMLVSSADAELTGNKIFKSRHRYHGSDVMSQKHTEEMCNCMSLRHHINRRNVLS